MTPEQREIARHMLGLPNRTRRSYRNRYCSDATPELLAMESAGWLKRSPKARMMTVEDMWFLTEDGARLALSKGERLDPEDFPGSLKSKMPA